MQCPIPGQAINAGQTRAGCWFRVFLSLYTSHHDMSYALKACEDTSVRFKGNWDGKDAQQQELNNMNPSKSSHTVSRMRGGHSNRADEICPFWPLLRGPPEYSAVFYAAHHCSLTPLGLWSDSCKDLEKTKTVRALSKKCLTMWPQARASTV